MKIAYRCRRALSATLVLLAMATTPASAEPVDIQADRFPARRAVEADRAGSSSLGEALIRVYQSELGTRRYSARALWCAWYLNRALDRIGLRGTGSDMARSYAAFGSRAAHPARGDIAVLARGRRGGHVGVVVGMDGRNPVLISANHNDTIAISTYPAGRVIAYRRIR